MPTPEDALDAATDAADASAATHVATATYTEDDRRRARAAVARAENLRTALDRSDTSAAGVVASFPARVQPVVDALGEQLAESQLDTRRAAVREALNSLDASAWPDVVDAVAAYDAQTAALLGDRSDPAHPLTAALTAADDARDTLDSAVTDLAAADAALRAASEAARSARERLEKVLARIDAALAAGDGPAAARWMVEADAQRAALDAATDISSLEAARNAARSAIDTPLDDWVTAESALLTAALTYADQEAEAAVRTERRAAGIETAIVDSLP